MARPPLLQLSAISLSFGGDPVFSGLDLVVQPGERLALVGRNGSGKSTLMKVIAGLVEPDSGDVIVQPGQSVGYMEQEPDMAGFATLGDFAAHGLEPGELYRVERAGEGLKFDPDRRVDTASGGERRRAALAALMAREPDLMLLDEPTNHLDIEAVEWLERELLASRAAQIIISHDRAFLRRLARGTLWVDRGQVRRLDKGIDAFEDWRDTVWAQEDEARHKLDRKIKAEARWAVEGISARRKRNQGRVRALADLRAERSAQIRRKGTADLALSRGESSGRLVFEAEGLAKSFGDRDILRDLSIRVQRGDRLALVGPNGAGKTTVLRLLLGEIAPDAGRVRQGTNLQIAVFDQARAQLDPRATLWDSLTGDPGMRVSGQADQVMVRGTPRHVVGYLKDFLFEEHQARSPVSALSGGEKARLLLARLMARESNVLVLDEPTNDLDVETLDLMQDLLGNYDGTVLLVSHDRDFLDRVAASTLRLDGQGGAVLYAGGWSDMRAQMGAGNAPQEQVAKSARNKPAVKPKPKPSGGLSFTQAHRLAALPGEIARLEAEIGKLEQLLADPELFTSAPVKFRKASEALDARQEKLAESEMEWLELAEKEEASQG